MQELFKLSFSSFLLKHFLLLFFIENRNLFAFKSILNLLPKCLNSPTQQVHIIVAFFDEVVDVFDSLFLVEVVQDYYFVLFVAILEQLGDCFVLFYSGAGEI